MKGPMSLSQAWKWDPARVAYSGPLDRQNHLWFYIDIVKGALLPVLFPSTSSIAPDLRQFDNRVFYTCFYILVNPASYTLVWRVLISF
jgi:hypothetical protein